jgi:imidazole glycerol phosphate synthase glutamine amidotransferase subunit
VSIDQALTTAGAAVRRVSAPADLADADLLVVPGVGAAAPAMKRLRSAGLAAPIAAWIAADRPFLGICLGMQLLFDASDEDGAETLGILAGRCVRLDAAPTLPHTGWNQVELRRAHTAFDGIAPGANFYFVHSFVCQPVDDGVILADTVHGRAFPSVVAHGRLLGVQFHPERSGRDGLRLLANVVAAAVPA